MIIRYIYFFNDIAKTKLSALCSRMDLILNFYWLKGTKIVIAAVEAYNIYFLKL